jgi:L-asparagine oxygenase
MPVEQHKDLIASSGSAVTFDLHTEDAFHPCAGDYIGLMCLRNPTAVSTALAVAPAEAIPSSSFNVLFEPRFIVGTNVQQRVSAVSQPSSVLWGNRSSPYLRINMNATRAIPGDAEADVALGALVQCLQSHTENVVFHAGDFWYIDNYRVAHGRGPFEPAFNGADRWLRRLYISSSFRQSTAFRSTPESRVLDPVAASWNF